MSDHTENDDEDEAIAMVSAMGFGLEYARGGARDGDDVEVRWFELHSFDFSLARIDVAVAFVGAETARAREWCSRGVHARD